MTPWTPDQRRAYAINRRREEAREKAMPLREEADRLITAIGWRRAHPVVERVMGSPIPGRHGNWWAAVTGQRAQRLVDELRQASLPRAEQGGQLAMFGQTQEKGNEQ